ncbi:hypothetical protein Gotur_006545 [Gossypium turneri]
MLNVNRLVHNLTNSLRSKFCGQVRVDTERVLQSCYSMKEIWSAFLSPNVESQFYELLIEDWWYYNLIACGDNKTGDWSWPTSSEWESTEGSIHDYYGNWVVDFSIFCGNCSNNVAEFMGIFNGVEVGTSVGIWFTLLGRRTSCQIGWWNIPFLYMVICVYLIDHRRLP